MIDESKGFYDDSNKLLKRDKPICTKTGIVIYKGKGDGYVLHFPDGTRKRSRVTATKIGVLFNHLTETNGNIDKSKRELGWK